MPIDQVCVGELVLSRNVDTGETTYKPVLARTLRPRLPMRKLDVGDETVLATPGHPFFSRGRWVTARDLGKESSLATEDEGTLRLAGNNAADEVMQAYNLVVADFGTYFVGKNRVLVHDVTPIR